MQHRDYKICVIGLGYVGLPLAVTFSKHYEVIGFDINKQRITELCQGIDNTREYSNQQLQDMQIQYTADPEAIGAANFYIITVPTPVNKAHQPILDPLRDASEYVGRVLDRSDFVVYESTVYPGATEEFCIPILEQYADLVSGKDFYVGYSPERINPGDKNHPLGQVTKIVSGQTESIGIEISAVYQKVLSAKVCQCASIKVAETAKLIENIQRDINIALTNELAIVCERLDIDTLDVLEVASTKWNFAAYRPGLVGGHCIGVDPYYFTYKATAVGCHPRVVLAGRAVNDAMGRFVVARLMKILLKRNNCFVPRRVTILGLTFKENVPDLRNTKVKDIVDELNAYGMSIQLHDPIIKSSYAQDIFAMPLTEFTELEVADALIIAVPHDSYRQLTWGDIEPLVRPDAVVFDIKGILPRELASKNITLLRL